MNRHLKIALLVIANILLPLALICGYVWSKIDKSAVPLKELEDRQAACWRLGGDYSSVRRNRFSPEDSAVECIWYESEQSKRNLDFRVGDTANNVDLNLWTRWLRAPVNEDNERFKKERACRAQGGHAMYPLTKDLGAKKRLYCVWLVPGLSKYIEDFDIGDSRHAAVFY